MNVSVIGITGRIGSIIKRVLESEKTHSYPDMHLVGGTSSSSTILDFENVIKSSDVVIDFSIPEATMIAVKIAAEHGKPLVIGTTGFSAEKIKIIHDNERAIPILHASNFSLTIQLMSELVRMSSKVLQEFDVSILDLHHKYKKDAPSGTALMLSKNIAHANVQINSVRAGNIAGEHSVDFIGENEMLSISHKAFNREVFVHGALKCAQWIVGKPPQLYSVNDYIEERLCIQTNCTKS